VGLFRLLLAMAVVLSHAGVPDPYRLVGGEVAVQAFYVVSGFYMALILTKKYADAPAVFFRNRFLRLFPAYWAVLTATAAWSGMLIATGRDGGYPGFGAARQIGRTMPAVGWLYLAFSNLCIVGQDLSLYLGLSHGRLAWTPDFRSESTPLYRFQLVPQAWSIALELVFYALAPLLVRARLATLWTIIAASIGVRLALISHGLDLDPWRYRFLPSELALFVLGVVAYKTSAARWPDVLTRTGWLQLAGLIAFVVTFGVLPGEAAKYAAFCLLTAAAVPAVFRATSRLPWDRYLGELSYPIYLVHLLVFELVARLRLGTARTRVAGVVATVLAAVLLYECLQKRIDRVRTAALSAAGERTVIP
jgi:peptidoglycan/LPS O-acetylase OafA/YrhL